MTVDDGFSVLEAGRTEMGTKHSSKAIEVVRVPVAKVIPNPYQPRKTFDEEGLQDTENKLIHIGKPIEMDEEKFMCQLIHLREAAKADSNAIRAMVKEIVPTYQMPEGR